MNRLIKSSTILSTLLLSILLSFNAYAVTLDIRINANDDDAEEQADGDMYLDSSDLEMVDDGETQKIGLRFNSIEIPDNAQITDAYISFHVDEADSESTSLTIHGEATNDANDFSDDNISSRSTTTSNVDWSPDSWDQAGDEEHTPNLKDIVQEIADRNGWSSGNSMAFFITGSGKRVADSYNGDSSTAPLLHIEYTIAETTSLDVRINSSDDDAEERPNGSMYLNSSDLEMVDDGETQKIGLRFNSLEIPKNAHITKARIKFHVDETDSENTHLTIHGEATHNASNFSAVNVSNRTTTNSSVSWNPGSWNHEGDEKKTPNLKAIIQEIVNRDDWQPSNSMAFLITGSGKRVADSYDGSPNTAALLHIEYTLEDDDDDESAECSSVIFEDDFESGLSDEWRTLKALGGFTPRINNGRLRLTNRKHDLSTAVTLDYVFPSQNNTFVVEFDYFAYGGCSDGENYMSGSSNAGDWGADGLAVILFDSSAGKSPRVGASGGSLGYANGHIELVDGSNEAQLGFEKGWFGVGIDEFGNFKTNDEGRRDLSGNTGSISDLDTEEPNTIAIRGAETPDGGSSGYRLLAASDPLDEALAQLDNGSYKSGRYRFTVDMSTEGLQHVTLSRDTGSGYEIIIGPFNALDGAYQQGITPEYFRLAFSSGTGGACNKHEIDNVRICGEGEVYTGNTPICWATTDDNNQIYKIDPRTGTGTGSLPQSTLIESDRVLRAEGGSYRPSDGFIYKFDDDGETYNSHENDTGPDSLYKINTTTGHVTLAAAALVPDHVDAAEFYINPDTQQEAFYAIEDGDTLYAFNPETWQPLSGYPKDIIGNDSIGGLAIHSETGVAYVIDDFNWDDDDDNEGTPPALYTLNLQTGQTTFLFNLQQVIDAEGLAFADDGHLYVENDSDVGSSSHNKILRIDLNNGSLEEVSRLTSLEGDIETLSCNGGASIAPPPEPPGPDPVFDYGDAPESYNVAFHMIPSNPTIYLGSTPPDDEVVEGETYPYEAGAIGDDSGDTDDEDGVQINGTDIQGQSFIANQTYNFSVTTHGNGLLHAWVDWNSNGLFEKSEKVANAVDGSSGTIPLSIAIPEDAVKSSTYARFRYSSHQELPSAGPANDGEVEDYTITITGGVDICYIDEIPSATYSTSSIVANSDRLNTDTRVFQTQFNKANWEGSLLSYDLVTTNDDGNAQTLKWDAANLIPEFSARSNHLYSYDPQASTVNKGITFNWASLNSAQRVLFKEDDEANNQLAQKRLNWIRGQRTNEKTESNSNGLFRPRSELLGDIIHSSPIFVGKRENYGYASSSITGHSSYASFLTQKVNRKEMIFLGANDGMLHAFDANTGVEEFAYVPNEVIPKLKKLTSIRYGCQDYDDCIPHDYTVDGKPTVGDAYFDTSWHTLLLGTFGKGGKGLFALEITDPESFTAAKVMWENTATQAIDNASTYQTHMGYSIPEPSIVHLNNGLWAAVVSNGYQSESERAVLFLIDVSNGHLIRTLTTPATSTPNGLSTPIAVDTNKDRTTDAVYAGDLLGNMWKFDLSDEDEANWSVAFHDDDDVALPLFKTCATSACNKYQIITAKPQVGHHPDGGYMVYFGTGKYFDTQDNVSTATQDIQTLYGIRDNNVPVDTFSTLVEQTILQESTVSNDLNARITSKNSVDYSTQNGWFMKLVKPDGTRTGERIISKALLRGGRLIVTTVIPPQECTWGGSSWIMELEALYGKPLSTPPLDLNNDKEFNNSDKVEYLNDADETIPEVPTGVQKTSLGLILSTPEIVNHTSRSEGKYVSGSSGSVGMFRESTSRFTGRQSWKQIR